MAMVSLRLSKVHNSDESNPISCRTMRSSSQQQLFPGQISSLEMTPCKYFSYNNRKKKVSYTAAANQTALAQIFQLFSFVETPKAAKLQLAQEINVWKSYVGIQSRAWGELLPCPGTPSSLQAPALVPNSWL